MDCLPSEALAELRADVAAEEAAAAESAEDPKRDGLSAGRTWKLSSQGFPRVPAARTNLSLRCRSSGREGKGRREEKRMKEKRSKVKENGSKTLTAVDCPLRGCGSLGSARIQADEQSCFTWQLLIRKCSRERDSFCTILQKSQSSRARHFWTFLNAMQSAYDTF